MHRQPTQVVEKRVLVRDHHSRSEDFSSVLFSSDLLIIHNDNKIPSHFSVTSPNISKSVSIRHPHLSATPRVRPPQL